MLVLVNAQNRQLLEAKPDYTHECKALNSEMAEKLNQRFDLNLMA